MHMLYFFTRRANSHRDQNKSNVTQSISFISDIPHMPLLKQKTLYKENMTDIRDFRRWIEARF